MYMATMEIKPYFPKPLCPHNERRELLVGYGSIGSIDVRPSCVGNNIEVLGHHSWMPVESLYALQPTLPILAPNEVSVEHLQEEPCLSKQKRRKKHFEKLMFLLGPLRGKFNVAEPECKEEARRVIRHLQTAQLSEESTSQQGRSEKLDSSHGKTGEKLHKYSESSDEELMGEDYTPKLSVVGSVKPQHLMDMCHGYIGQSYNTDMMNSLFCGGCLRYQRARESVDDFIAFPSGLSMENLNICGVSEENGNITIEKLDCVFPTQSRILEVDTSWIRNSGFCVVRCKEKCVRFEIDRMVNAGQPHWLQVNTVDWGLKELPTSISLSPYIAGEVCVVTSMGKLYLWHLDGRLETIQSGLTPRFTCPDTWRQCHYGAHPRALLVSDRTGVAQLDLRRPAGSSSRDMDIFALPNKSLHKNERVMVTKRHPSVPFFHVIATQYSIIVLDERFANHPVLFWTHTLQSPPQYIDIIEKTMSSCQDDILLVSDQGHSDTVAFQFNIKNQGKPPQSTCAPWRISHIDDFTRIMTRGGIGPDSSLVFKKVSIPLAGMSGISLRKSPGMSILQITSHGDMFCQNFKAASLKELLNVDKVACAGPGSVHVKLDDNSLKVCVKWLEEAAQQVQKAESVNPTMSYQTWDATMHVNALSCQTYPHILCPLCMPMKRAQTGDAEPPAEHCNACGLSLVQATILQRRGQEDRVVANISENLMPLPSGLFDLDTTKYSDAMSSILVKLWAGETDNLHDLLKQLEEERKEGIIHKMKDTEKTDTSCNVHDSVDKDSDRSVSQFKQISQDYISITQTPGPASPIVSPTNSRCGSVSSPDSHNSIISQSPGFLATPLRVRRQSALQSPSRSPFTAKTNDSSRIKEGQSSYSPFSFLSSQHLSQSQSHDAVKPKKKRKLVEGF